MARVQPAYVEDYNSLISEVIPLTRRHAHPKLPKAKPTLETHFEVSDSGYESTLPSEHLSTASPEESATPTPPNDTPPGEEEEDAGDAESEIHFPPRRSHQYAYTSQSSSSPLSQKLSSHLSSQLPSQGPTSNHSASKPSSIQSTSRPASPAVHRGSSNAPRTSSSIPSTALTEEENCDCPECKTTSKSSPTSHHNALSSPWNLNFPPFTNSGTIPASPHSSQHWSSYASATPGRSYPTRDYGYAYPPTPTTTDSGDSESGSRRIRERLPARPLSYGGPAISTASNPVTTNGSWHAYSYYGGHVPGTTPVSTPPPSYGQSAYSPPPTTPSSAAVPATPSSQSYSAMIGGGGGGGGIGGSYGSYPYSSQDYYSQTQVAPALPSIPAASNTTSEYSSMPPPSAIPYRRSNRYSTGAVGNSTYGSPMDYNERYHERYAREYAEKYGSYTDRYSDKMLDKYSDKYPSKYSAEKYPSEKYPKYGDRYPDKYYERYLDNQKYSADRYPDKYGDYHQQNAPVGGRPRASQGSGTYAYPQDAPPRSTSVPPVDPNAPSFADIKRRTATPQPMRRRDSTGGSANAGALARISSSSLSRSIENSAVDDDYYSRTPPTSYQYHHRYHSSYDANVASHHALTTQQPGGSSAYYYRSSDSGYSGGSSENKGDEMVPLTAHDGEPFTIRYPTGVPVKLQLNGGATQMTIQLGAQDKSYSIESPNMYRHIRPQQRQQLALQHDVSSRGPSRQLEYDRGYRGYRGSADSESDYYGSGASEREGVFGELDDSDRAGYPSRYRRRGSVGAV